MWVDAAFMERVQRILMHVRDTSFRTGCKVDAAQLLADWPEPGGEGFERRDGFLLVDDIQIGDVSHWTSDGTSGIGIVRYHEDGSDEAVLIPAEHARAVAYALLAACEEEPR